MGCLSFVDFASKVDSAPIAAPITVRNVSLAVLDSTGSGRKVATNMRPTQINKRVIYIAMKYFGLIITLRSFKKCRFHAPRTVNRYISSLRLYTRTNLNISAIITTIVISTSPVQGQTENSFMLALQACGAGTDVTARSTFEEAFDLASGRTPGSGQADVSIFGYTLDNVLSQIQSDQAKLTVLSMYYSCVLPRISGQGTARSGTGDDIVDLFRSDGYCDKVRYLISTAAESRYSEFTSRAKDYHNPNARNGGEISLWVVHPFLSLKKEVFFDHVNPPSNYARVAETVLPNTPASGITTVMNSFRESIFDPIYTGTIGSIDYYEKEFLSATAACIDSWSQKNSWSILLQKWGKIGNGSFTANRNARMNVGHNINPDTGFFTVIVGSERQVRN